MYIYVYTDKPLKSKIQMHRAMTDLRGFPDLRGFLNSSH